MKQGASKLLGKIIIQDGQKYEPIKDCFKSNNAGVSY